MIQCLVDKGADVLAVNKKGRTALLDSLRSNYEEGSEILIKHGSSVQVADRDGNTALHFAVHEPSLLKQIKKGGDVNAVNLRCCTPLHQAAYCGYALDTTRRLLKTGANVHCRDDQGNTPLHVAVAHAGESFVDLLIKNGSDVHATNIQGKTCLHMIARFGDGEVLEKLIACRVQVNAVDELGSTALHRAVLENDQWLVEGLLRHGADPEAVDFKGCTSLHVGCCSGTKEAVFVMINHGR